MTINHRHKFSSKAARASYTRYVKRRNFQIKVTIAVFFIAANLILAIFFWPMLKEHRDKMSSGERVPLIEIRRER